MGYALKAAFWDFRNRKAGKKKVRNEIGEYLSTNKGSISRLQKRILYRIKAQLERANYKGEYESDAYHGFINYINNLYRQESTKESDEHEL